MRLTVNGKMRLTVAMWVNKNLLTGSLCLALLCLKLNQHLNQQLSYPYISQGLVDSAVSALSFADRLTKSTASSPLIDSSI